MDLGPEPARGHLGPEPGRTPPSRAEQSPAHCEARPTIELPNRTRAGSELDSDNPRVTPVLL